MSRRVPRWLARTWERLGREDPMWAVLTDPAKRGGGWDAGEFFATGRADWRRSRARALELHPQLAFGAALDFGCGVGRVTRALAESFERVEGVDVAASMIETARALDRSGGTCVFRAHARADLSCFDDATFDFVWSRITLQHVPTRLALAYVREFGRVLRRGGLAMFQVPDRRRAGRLRARIARSARIAFAAVTGTPAMLVFEHARRDVERALSQSGLTLLAAGDDDALGSGWHSLTYVALKPR